MTGVAGLLNTSAGRWVRAAVGWLDAMTGKVTGQLTGVVVVGLVAAVAIYVVVIHLRRGRTDTKTLTAAAIAPVAVTTIPGPIGAAAFTAVSAVTGAMGWAVGAAFGLQ